MKLHKKLLILMSILCIGALIYITYPRKVIPIVQMPGGTYAGYKDVNELEQHADLIIVGTPQKSFQEYEPTKQYTEWGTYQGAYTVTDINILKILKGVYVSPSSSIPVIPVLQGAAIIDIPGDLKLQKYFITEENYSVMEKGKKYLLFLKKTDLGIYGILSLNQGKFNVDNEDLNEKDMGEHNKQWSNLRDSVLERYGNIVN